MKGGTGTKVGVELRYYKPPEYKYLSMEEKDELRKLRPESKSIKRDNKNKKGNSDDKNIGKGQREKKRLKNNFKGKVAALKKQQKNDMKEMTELATVISGANQAPPRACRCSSICCCAPQRDNQKAQGLQMTGGCTLPTAYVTGDWGAMHGT